MLIVPKELPNVLDLLTAFVLSAAVGYLAVIGEDIAGVAGEVIQTLGIGGAALVAFLIVRKAYNQRSEIQEDTIESLRAENERLRRELEDTES